MGNTPARRPRRAGDSPFRAVPADVGKEVRLRTVRVLCRLAAAGSHRTRAGLVEIVELARMMNPSGKRRYDAEAILASLRKQGEGIVCASGNGGITRSSDLHEWR